MTKPIGKNSDKKISEKLSRLKSMIISFSAGDFSKRVDPSTIEDDEFAEVFAGMDLLADNLSRTIGELEQKQNKLQIKAKERSAKITTLNKKLSRNIVEQQIVEDALRDTNEQYRLLAESAQDFIFIIDRNLIVRYVNDFGAQIFSSTPIELMGKPLSDLFPPALFDEFKRSIEATFSTLQPVSKQTKVGFPGKKEVWLETKLTPIPEKMGRVHTILGISRDISERMKAEEELRQSEQKFRTLADTVSAGIIIVKNGKFCYANQYLLETTGYSWEELQTMSYIDIIHPDFKETIKKRQAARLLGEYIFPHIEYKVTLKNGKESWVHQTGGLIDYEGEPATLVTVWDITEEKIIKNALAAEKERLDVILGSIREGVISTDIESNIITINKAAEILLGCSKETSIGCQLEEVWSIFNPKDNSPYRGIFQKMSELHASAEYKKHCLLKSRDGAEHQVELAVAPLIAQDGNTIGMVIVLRDVTERMKLESEIFKVRKLESLGVLAGGIAHDFNNILTGIITNLFMAKCTLPQSSENYNLLVDAEKACFRASRLTKQLLTFSKGGAPVKEIASIKDIIEDTVGFCLSGSNATYSIELPDDLMATNIDKGQIDQVINNLLINALQAMPSGGNISVKAENVNFKIDSANSVISHNPSFKPGRYVKVSIRDEGVGISRKDLEKIFDPYFTTKPKGTGLGLTTSYAILKNHDGVITVDSYVGQGSTFSFYLPALDVSLKESVVEKKEKKHRTGKILVMDDDDAVRTVVSQILKSYGYEAVCAATGHETIKVYKDALDDGKSFNVVIMDLTIPGGIGGKEVVRLLNDIDPHLKAIVTSGYSNDPIMSNFKDYGFAGVIAKPFIIDEFISIVDMVMES
jgi:PAS domain S-box-containing protein